jgi:hypothetical protein
MMGEALQYIISGYTRIESDPKLSAHYAQQAKEAVIRVKYDSINLKKGKL